MRERVSVGHCNGFHKSKLLAFAFMASQIGIFAAPLPEMVMDIRNGSASSYPSQLTKVGKTLFFVANDGIHGEELWSSDGTEGGTKLVKDIRKGKKGSTPTELKAVGSSLYFVASDGIHGRELWTSNGTSSGTRLVKDIYNGSIGSSPTELAASNGMIFFVCSDAIHGRELWRSDGSQSGTILLCDVKAGKSSSYVAEPTNHKNAIFFTAASTEHGRELWKSDGSPEGTIIVKDIIPGSTSSEPRRLASAGDFLYFQDDYKGAFLWKSDGTEAGTMMVKDVRKRWTFELGHFTPVGNRLFFSAFDELWVSDGTEQGTKFVKKVTLSNLTYDSFPISFGDQLVFLVGGINGTGLWRSNGTVDGTRRIFDTGVLHELVKFDDYVYGTNGDALFRTNGKSNNLSVIASYNTSPAVFGFQNLTVMGKYLFFTAKNQRGYELWKMRR